MEQQTPNIEIPRCAAMLVYANLVPPGREYCAHHAAFEGRATWDEEELFAGGPQHATS